MYYTVEKIGRVEPRAWNKTCHWSHSLLYIHCSCQSRKKGDSLLCSGSVSDPQGKNNLSTDNSGTSLSHSLSLSLPLSLSLSLSILRCRVFILQGCLHHNSSRLLEKTRRRQKKNEEKCSHYNPLPKQNATPSVTSRHLSCAWRHAAEATTESASVGGVQTQSQVHLYICIYLFIYLFVYLFIYV